MQVKKSIGSAKWLDGYGYWRGQYTERNSVYRNMVYERTLGYNILNSLCGEDAELKKGLEHSCFSGKNLFSYIKVDTSCIDFELLKEVLDIDNKVKTLFPYTYYQIDSMDIIYKVSNGSSLVALEGRYNPVHSWISKGDGIIDVEIDTKDDTNYIVHQIRFLIEALKSNNFDVNIDSDGDMKKLQTELCAKGVGYRPISDESRAIGLLLFDYLEENEVSDAEAIRWARKELALRGPKNFGKADSSERQFQRWLANTRKCIDAAEVLEI